MTLAMPHSDATEAAPFYSAPAGFLQQGDVYCAPLVAPITDAQQRIFRSFDGRHGSVVIAGEADGKVFSRTELITALQAAVRGALHTEPFTATPDGQMEFVVTNADLIEYFIVISQTCDICGVDHAPKALAMILKAKSMRHLCRTEPLPFKGEALPLTIHEYMSAKNGFGALEEADEATYSYRLREIWQAWKPTTNDGRDNRGKINNYLSSMQKKGGPTYFLAHDSYHGMPPLYIDFLTAFTVTTSQLETMKEKRIATLSEAYRIDFAQSFAAHIGRVALPVAMQSPSALS